MRAAIVLAAALVLGLALSGSAGSADAPSTRAPQLRLVDLAPVKLRGTLFLPGEAVRVTLTVRRTWVRHTRANRSGTFTVSFGLVAIEPCRGSVIGRALGARGSRARFERECRPTQPAPP
jgi:hypothetical protein